MTKPDLRILHTGDWHLGQHFHGYDRAEEHQIFLDWLLNQAVEHEADALLIPGDVYDNTNPSSVSQRQFYSFLRELNNRCPGAQTVYTAGNHDAAGRLQAPAPLLDMIHVTVVGKTRDENYQIDPERLVVPLMNRSQEVQAWCLAIPFLRQTDVPHAHTKTPSFEDGVRNLYQQAFDVAERKRNGTQPIIAMAHGQMAGAQVSESERNACAPGSNGLAHDIFPSAVSYVALAHQHLAQIVGDDETRRYSGSPMPMSFAEIGYEHRVEMVDFIGGHVAAIRSLKTPRPVDLLQIPPIPAPLDQVIEQLAAINSPEAGTKLLPYLKVKVLVNQPEPGLRQAITQALTGKHVRLCKIELTSERGRVESKPKMTLDEVGATKPIDVFARMFREQFSDEPGDDLVDAFNEITAATLAAPAEQTA